LSIILYIYVSICVSIYVSMFLCIYVYMYASICHLSIIIFPYTYQLFLLSLSFYTHTRTHTHSQVLLMQPFQKIIWEHLGKLTVCDPVNLLWWYSPRNYLQGPQIDMNEIILSWAPVCDSQMLQRGQVSLSKWFLLCHGSNNVQHIAAKSKEP
jgi:hypothetical protein